MSTLTYFATGLPQVRQTPRKRISCPSRVHHYTGTWYDLHVLAIGVLRPYLPVDESPVVTGLASGHPEWPSRYAGIRYSNLAHHDITNFQHRRIDWNGLNLLDYCPDSIRPVIQNQTTPV